MWGIGSAPTSKVMEVVFGFPFSNFNGDCLREHGWRYLFVFHEHYIIDIENDDFRGHRCCLVPLLFTLKTDAEKGSRFVMEVPPPSRWADVEVGVTVFLLSARVGISLGELADFLVGWLGPDVAGDDATPWGERKWWETEEAFPLFID